MSTDLINIWRKTNDTDLVNVLSFQSQEVLNTLMKEHVYFADKNKSREKRDYSLDVEQLDGMNPIWCFSPIGIRYLNGFGFSEENLKDAVMFQEFKCQMSLRSTTDMNNFVVLDLLVNAKDLKVGKTHNAYIGAVVIPKIDVGQLMAVYKIEYDKDDKDDSSWYYPKVKVLERYSPRSILKEEFKCRGDD